MSTSVIEASVVGVVAGLAERAGVSLPVEQMRAIAEQAIGFIVGKVDDEAKRQAAAAGAERAAKVVDMESAEAAARGRK